MKNALINYYTNQIIAYTKKNCNGNFEIFKQQNNNLQTFLINSHLETLATHELKIDDKEYQEILKNITIQNIQQYTKEEEIQTEKNYTVKTKRINEKKVSGFVDTLIIAFITGAFIGIILLNLYSKIAQHI